MPENKGPLLPQQSVVTSAQTKKHGMPGPTQDCVHATAICGHADHTSPAQHQNQRLKNHNEFHD